MAAGLVLVTLLSGAASAREQAPRPEPHVDLTRIEWSEKQIATLRSFFERVDVEAVLDGVSAPRARVVEEDPVGLGAALGMAWDAPFRFVQRVISFVPYSGSVRGARGTLLAGAGNSLDQSLLLAQLYRQRGVRTRLVHGSLRWQQSVELVGRTQADRAHRGDPWLRWVELAADHWWLEAQRGADWVALDPSFGGDPGTTFGRRRRVTEAPAMSQRATVTVEVLRGQEPMSSTVVSVEELIGVPIELFLHKQVRGPQEAGNLGANESDVELPQPAASELPEEAPQPLDGVLPRLPEGPVSLQLQLGDTSILIGPIERRDLRRVELRVRARVPMGPGAVLIVPWGERLEARLLALVGAGPVQAGLLARQALGIHTLLTDLAAAEVEALQAYNARPRPATEDEATRVVAVPREIQARPAELDDHEPEASTHPADALHVAVVRASLEFERTGLGLLASALLAATDQLTGPEGLARPGIRLVGMNWQLPEPDRAGELTIWIRDPIAVGGLDPVRRRGVQSAYGLLRSAVLGHVLNSVADQPPATAFDVTLRTVGSGQRMGWWDPGSEPPSEWPSSARAAALRDLDAGYAVIGPPAPILKGAAPLLGWWASQSDSGATAGRIETDAGTAQGRVMFVEARDPEDLESMLATLRVLHRASRWLVAAGTAASGALADLVPRACAATSLVGELLVASAPDSWAAPMFGEFCAGPSGAATGR